MTPMLDAFEEIAAQITYQPPNIPLISNVTGKLFNEAPDAAYWRHHVRQPVQFATGMKTLDAAGVTAFLEIGPQPHLLSNGRRNLPQSTALWLPSLHRKQEDWQPLLNSLARLCAA
jgi:acyl transferase domain-containing protein